VLAAVSIGAMTAYALTLKSLESSGGLSRQRCRCGKENRDPIALTLH
jgi:hypothetical protein